MTIKEFRDYPDTSTPINSGNLNDNFKEIKSVFNNQIAQGWYKTAINPTFTFVSYDSETLTGVVSSNLDMTPYLSVGMKVKFTQNSETKYALITAITSTQLTLFLGTDYSINNSAISNTYYSMLKSPFGFPMDPDKWSIIFTDIKTRQQANPTKNVWYNLGGLSFYLPIGEWITTYKILGVIVTKSPQTTFLLITLSTTNNDESNGELTNKYGAYSTDEIDMSYVLPPTKLSATAKTQYFINAKTEIAVGISSIYFLNKQSKLVIKATCAYL